MRDRLAQIGGKCDRPYPASRKQHDDALAVHGQRGRDFRADETDSDDGESVAFTCQSPEPLVIVQCSKINDRPFAERQASRRSTGGE